MKSKIRLCGIGAQLFCVVLIMSLTGSSRASEIVGAGEPGGLLPPLSEEGQRDLEKLARDLAPVEEKLKLAVLDATVSVDGVARPDLGASFSDTLSARLLSEKAFEIIDSSALGSTNPNSLGVSNHQLDQTGAVTPGPATALDFGKATGADYVVVPTLVCTAKEIRMTIRKLRTPSGKVERIFQETVKGDHRFIFALAEKVALQLLPEKPLPPQEKPEPRFNYVKVWMSPPPPADVLKQEILRAPKALRNVPALSGNLSGSTAAARAWGGINNDRREPSRLGAISVVDHDWSFCELSCPVGSVHLHDQIFAWGGGAYDNLISMNVSRIDGQRVIAEFDAVHPLSKTLRSGLAIYTWKPLIK